MGLLSTVLGPVLDFFGKPIQKYQETKQIVVKAKAERQATEQTNAAVWEKNVLIKSGVYLRWTCALHLFAGLDYTIYASMVGKDAAALWVALEQMPDWYAGLLATMFGFAFGSAPLKAAGGKLFARWRSPKGPEAKYGKVDK